MSQIYVKHIYIEDDKDIYASNFMNIKKTLHSVMVRFANY